jgi:hypothetical protein
VVDMAAPLPSMQGATIALIANRRNKSCLL